MTKMISIQNRSRGSLPVIRAKWCDSYFCRLIGLSFRRKLPEGEGLMLVFSQESRGLTSITMWGVFFPLGVAWINSTHEVVDVRIAKPWRTYLPRTPARYVLEGHPSILESLSVGDELNFIFE